MDVVVVDMKFMTRFLTALAVLALAVAPSAAIAKKPGKKAKKPTPRAKVLRAVLEPTTTDAEYAGIRGKAHLVDGKKNDKVTIHVRGLRPNTPYLWHVHEADGDPDPCDAGSAGPIVTAFNYKLPKLTNASGNLNAKARSKTFTREAGETYYVNVHAADGTVLACGILEAKKAKKNKGKGKSRGKGRQQGSSKGKGKRP